MKNLVSGMVNKERHCLNTRTGALTSWIRRFCLIKTRVTCRHITFGDVQLGLNGFLLNVLEFYNLVASLAALPNGLKSCDMGPFLSEFGSSSL